MKKYLLILIIILFSCGYGKEFQVERKFGVITKIDMFNRYGTYVKRIEWTLDRDFIVYQYADTGYVATIGEQGQFLLAR